MLIKLIKHDLKSTYRTLLPIYIGMMSIAVLFAFSSQFNNPALDIIVVVIFGAIMAATAVSLIMVSIRLFSARLFSNEGYLSFTLPVSVSELYLSKIITAMIWSFVTFLVISLASSIFVAILLIINSADFSEVMRLIGDNLAVYSSMLFKLMNVTLPQAIISMASAYALFLFAIVVSNTSYFSRNKTIVAVVLFFVLSFIVNNIEANVFGEWIIFTTRATFDINWLNYMLVLGYQAIVFVILFIGSVWLSNHKLELQ